MVEPGQSIARVCVVYSDADGDDVTDLALPLGATVADAVAASGILGRRRIDVAGGVGIWGRVVAMTEPLVDGDRVEIYRPLTVDPKEARRRRAEVRKKQKRR